MKAVVVLSMLTLMVSASYAEQDLQDTIRERDVLCEFLKDSCLSFFNAGSHDALCPVKLTYQMNHLGESNMRVEFDACSFLKLDVEGLQNALDRNRLKRYDITGVTAHFALDYVGNKVDHFACKSTYFE